MQFFKHLLFLATALFPLSHGEPSRGNNIVEVGEHELPFLVSIITVDHIVPEPEFNHYCTGSLISSKHVLTAAHCVADREFQEVNVLVGSSDLTQAKPYNVSTWINYNDWFCRLNNCLLSGENDIAIITLDKEMHVDHVRPAKLAYTLAANLFRHFVTSVGWGDSEMVQPVKIARKVPLKIISNIECEIELQEFARNITDQIDPDSVQVTNRYFCTRNKQWALIDEGDSDGPVLDEKNKLIGINKGTVPHFEGTDHSQDHVNQRQFNLHVSVYSYRKYIEYHLKEIKEL